ILVVEDESIVAMDIMSMLERMEYDVVATVATGERAIQEVAKNHPDLVLMDIMLKGDMDGIQTTEKIREMFHIPVIYLTANAEDHTLQRAKITEPYGYIIKPFQERELNTTIEIALYKHKSERKLEESEKWLSTILGSIGDAIIATNPLGYITFMNPSAENLTGWQEKDAIDRDLNGILCMFDESTNKPIENLISKETHRDPIIKIADNIALISKDGKKRLIEYSKSPIGYREGEVIGIVFALRDITEKRRMEEEAIRNQRLESLSLLAGGIAHDFNNILTVMMANISLAMMYTDLTKINEKLTGAEKAFNQAKSLTQQLLTFAKGGVPIKKTVFIDEMLEDSAIFALRGANIKYEAHIEDNLWPVFIDQGQINQVIGNLVINGAQAMPKGGTIKVIARNVILEDGHGLPLENGLYVKISVEDQGTGIPENLLPRIFEPYFTTKEKGNGLGLATSHTIIKNHGGHIMIETKLGVGTTFHIYLPVSTEPLVREEKEEEIEEKKIEGKGRILVVDDDKDIQELIISILGNYGYEVEVVSDNDSAINIYNEALKSGNPYDLIIMDLIVPGSISGVEAIQKLKNTNSQVKAIVSSGYSTDPVMINFNEYGFKAAVSKPYEIKDMVEMVNKVITEESLVY
ncbi:response regulator, partial [Candidatus Poribacteria bacterium]|nr:response regulator [Candidatus Poribacteria bacterium]